MWKGESGGANDDHSVGSGGSGDFNCVIRLIRATDGRADEVRAAASDRFDGFTLLSKRQSLLTHHSRWLRPLLLAMETQQ